MVRKIVNKDNDLHKWIKANVFRPIIGLHRLLLGFPGVYVITISWSWIMSLIPGDIYL